MANEFNKDLEIIFLCGLFAEDDEAFVETNNKIVFEQSANNFQKKVLKGIEALGNNFSVISAPFIGPFPNRSKMIKFKEFTHKGKNINFSYLSFCNIWGYRNISRKKAFKNELMNKLNKSVAKEILIVGYSAHEPIIESAVYAKQIDKRVKISLIVPDLPQYMNFSSKKSCIYSLLKKVDKCKIDKYMCSVDSFLILTEYMKKPLNIGDRPYIVIEGISDKYIDKSRVYEKDKYIRYIVYTGGLFKAYGIINLVRSFQMLNDDSLRLVLCGDGDCNDYILSAAKEDSRILFTGKVSSEEALRWQNKASVLVNPRENTGEYVKYSFPSKIIEYLETGKPVVSYLLKGMPKIYSEFIYEIDESIDPVKALFFAINRALADDKENIINKHKRFADYSNQHLHYKNVVKSLIDLNIND